MKKYFDKIKDIFVKNKELITTGIILFWLLLLLVLNILFNIKVKKEKHTEEVNYQTVSMVQPLAISEDYKNGFNDGKNYILDNILNVIYYNKLEVFNNGFDLTYRLDFIDVFDNGLLDTTNLLDIFNSIYSDKVYQLYNIYIPENNYIFLSDDNGILPNYLKVNFIQAKQVGDSLIISFFDNSNIPIYSFSYFDLNWSYEYIYIQYNTNTSVMDNALIYNQGYDTGYNDGMKVSDELIFNDGKKVGFDEGWRKGYSKGLNENNNGFAGELLAIFFTSLTFFGSFEILPGFKLIYGVGIIVMISLIAWLSGRKGGDK